MFRSTLALALLVLPAGAMAQDRQAESGQPPQRVRNVTIRPGEKCPPSTATDVVVCGTLTEPYRIPQALRDDHPVTAQNQSWVNRAATADQIGRVAGGLPDTCSPVGSGGQTGCGLQASKQWVAAKTEEKRQQSSAP